MPEVQSLVSDPRVHSIDSPMCRWSLKARGSNDKVEFMRMQTRWLTGFREIAEVLRGDGRWKRDRRHVHMTGKSETVSEYPDTKLVTDALNTMKLVGAKGVDSPRVTRNEEQTAQIENSEKTHISGVDFVPQLGDEVGKCRSRQG